MIVEYTKNQDIDYILDNLSDKNAEELEIHFGENWKNYAKSEMLANLDKHSVTAKTNDNTPVIVTGVLNDDDTAGWLYFLHTGKITDLPLFELIKKSKKQVKKWMHDYNTLNACILNTNVETIKWAELVGFKIVDMQGCFFVMNLNRRDCLNNPAEIASSQAGADTEIAAVASLPRKDGVGSFPQAPRKDGKSRKDGIKK